MALNLNKNQDSASGSEGSGKLKLNLEKKEIVTPHGQHTDSLPNSDESTGSKKKGTLFVILLLLIIGGVFAFYQFSTPKIETDANSLIGVDTFALSPADTSGSLSSSGNQGSNGSDTSNAEPVAPTSTSDNNSSDVNVTPDKTIQELDRRVKNNNAQIASFSPGSKDVSFTDQDVVSLIVKYLNQNSTNNITLLGFASSEGDEANNQLLSENRAKSLKDYLVSKGISQEKITVKGMGIINPVADNSTVEGRKKNRRVEFVLD